jgi:cysteine-S-conjugate beta-lyase
MINRRGIVLKYNFDEVIDRTGTFSLKWDYAEFLKTYGITERFDEETIPVHIADMDFKCAQPISDALKRLTEHNIYGYTAVFPYGAGLKYYEAIIRWFKNRRNWTIQPQEIVYVNGTVEAAKLAIQAFTEKGDGILINRPIYSPFAMVIRKTGRVVVNSQLRHNDGYYTIDFEDFEVKAADEKTRLFILCHPHNPTGRIWTDEELIRMTDICRKHGVIIVADEIHGDLIRKDLEFHPLASVAGPKGILTCTAVNKTFNLAGLHATNVVIQDPGLKTRFVDSIGWITPNPFTIAAVIAAYNEGAEWLEQLLEYLDRNIDWVLDFLKRKMPKVKCFRPEGTYIMWMDFREYGLSAKEVHRKIYIDANVVLEGGALFDPEHGDGFERICVPTRQAVLEEVFERIARQFEGL